MDWQEKNIVKNGPVTKSNLQIQCNSHQIPMTFFTDLEKANLKHNWHRNVGGITAPGFKLYYSMSPIPVTLLLTHSNRVLPLRAAKHAFFLNLKP
jgi:hypothetical protein